MGENSAGNSTLMKNLKGIYTKDPGGEIAFLRAENYSTSVHLRSCFLGESRWLGGTFCLNGTVSSPNGLVKRIGTDVGLPLERPDRSNGVLFDNLSALDNLCTSLLPKAGKWFAARRLPTTK